MSSHVSPIVQCCIQIIQSVHSTHELIVGAAMLIVADAEANHRFYELKSSASEERLLAYLEEYEKLADSLSRAYSRFESDASLGRATLLKEITATQQTLSRRP
jgi:arginyl-tRNA--protein-N-Asp/Glu arginylyltransferase